MRNIALSVFLLLIVTFAALSPTLNNGFTNWDDQIMITQNAKIMSLSPENIKIMFTQPHERLYHPLVLLSYALEYHFFGLNPFIYHLTNLILHLLSTLLVFWLIYLLTGRIFSSLIVSLLFGIHPMHVESVAWLAERKDVLYAFFFLFSLIPYVYYIKSNQKKYLYLSLILFFFSFISKPMAITLPFVLLLFDYLFERKLEWKLIFEKTWYFIITFIFGIIMVISHYYSQSSEPIPSFSLLDRFFIACHGIIFYLLKLIAPIKLSCYYPMPEKIGGLLPLNYLLSPLAVLAIVIAVIYSMKYTKKIAFGFLFYLIVIFPVLQILPVGLGILADRYTYISYLGIFYLIGQAIFRKKALSILLIIIIGVFSYLTWQRCFVWRDSISLWNDVIKNYPNAALAYYNRGDEYFLIKKDFDRAYSDFTRAIEVDPNYSSAYINRGLIKYYRGQIDGSIKDYDAALKINPKIAEAYGNRGNSYHVKGDNVKALVDYARALTLKKDYAEVYYNMANIYVERNDFEKALLNYNEAIRIRPNYAAVYNNRGNAYFKSGRLDEAFSDFDRAISADPNYPDAYYNRAVVFAARKEYRLALDDVNRAAALGLPVDKNFVENLKKAINR